MSIEVLVVGGVAALGLLALAGWKLYSLGQTVEGAERSQADAERKLGLADKVLDHNRKQAEIDRDKEAFLTKLQGLDPAARAAALLRLLSGRGRMDGGDDPPPSQSA